MDTTGDNVPHATDVLLTRMTESDAVAEKFDRLRMQNLDAEALETEQ